VGLADGSDDREAEARSAGIGLALEPLERLG
jgi:hypothetical protein